MNAAPILIVDSDPDDKELLQEAWEQLEFKNPLIFFENGEDILLYLKSEKTTPFLILCEVNLPKQDGFELKEKIRSDPTTHYKSIPFVFWSTEVSKSQIQKAYDLGSTGFFVKGSRFNEIKESLVEIVMYWLKSKTPN